MEVTGQLHALAALLAGKSPQVHIGLEAGSASELVWTMWREKSCPTGTRTPAVQPVARLYIDWAIPTRLQN
jgi:hypothetical protein